MRKIFQSPGKWYGSGPEKEQKAWARGTGLHARYDAYNLLIISDCKSIILIKFPWRGNYGPVFDLFTLADETNVFL